MKELISSLPSKDYIIWCILDMTDHGYYTKSVLDINYYWQVCVNNYKDYKDINQIDRVIANISNYSVEYVGLYRKIRNNLIHPSVRNVFYGTDRNILIDQRDRSKLLRLVEKLKEV